MIELTIHLMVACFIASFVPTTNASKSFKAFLKLAGLQFAVTALSLVILTLTFEGWPQSGFKAFTVGFQAAMLAFWVTLFHSWIAWMIAELYRLRLNRKPLGFITHNDPWFFHALKVKHFLFQLVIVTVAYLEAGRGEF